MRETLKRLPKTLDETYARILANIQEDYHREAAAALAWLTISKRPLSLEELADAMTINISSTPAFDPEDRFLHPQDALTVLPSLVSVTPSNLSGPEVYLIVNLAYYSVKEYLTSTRIPEGPASRFATHEPNTQQKVLEDCIQYIFCVQGKDREQRWKLAWNYPLLKYAHANWRQHALKCSSELPLVTKKMIVDLLEHPSAWNMFLYRAKWDVTVCGMMPKKAAIHGKMIQRIRPL